MMHVGGYHDSCGGYHQYMFSTSGFSMLIDGFIN